MFPRGNLYFGNICLLMETFSEWVYDEMKRRYWTQADLSKKSAITPAQISRVINEGRSPGVDFCRGIAKAFKLSEQEVFIRAGIMTTPPEYDVQVERIKKRYMDMSPERRKLLDAFIDTLYAQQEKEDSDNASRNRGTVAGIV